LLCTYDENFQLKVEQLNACHDIFNKSEIERMEKIGLNLENLKSAQNGKFYFTRCIGNYALKGGYLENEFLKPAISEPFIATPDVYGGIPIENINEGFLVLMSEAVYRPLEQNHDIEDVNHHVARIVAEQLKCSHTIEGVAQTVINKISYSNYNSEEYNNDMTLVIRNLNHPVGTLSAPQTPVNQSISSNFSVSVPYNSDVTQTNSDVMTQQDLQLVIQPHRIVTSSIVTSSEDQSTEDEQTPTNQSQKSNNNQHFQHSGSREEMFFSIDKQSPLVVDSDNKINSYVSFNCFDNNAWNMYCREKNLKFGTET